MSTSNDGNFVKTFGIVLGLLVFFMFTVMTIANIISPEHGDVDSQLARITRNIAPVGSVNTDPNAVQAAAPAAEDREPRTGEQVVNAACAACHLAGVAGAPKLDDAADWQARLTAAGGIDGLVQSVINGKGGMPPRGGSDASDEEIRNAVAFIIGE